MWRVKADFVGAIVATDPTAGQGQKLLEQMRDLMRVKHYSFRTEQTYCDSEAWPLHDMEPEL